MSNPPFQTTSPGTRGVIPQALIASAFVISAWSGAPVPEEGVASKVAPTHEAVKAPLTSTGFQSAKTTADGIDMTRKTVAADLPVAKPTALRMAQRRILALERLPDSAFAEDRVKPTRDTLVDAGGILEKIAFGAPSQPLPMIDLDGDGVIVMTWHGNGRAGSLTVHGDGTYSYYVKLGKDVAKRGDAKISAPLDDALVRVLSI